MRGSRLAVLVGTVLGIVALSSGSAAAGGPTSVLIVSPESGATASLHTTDDDYDLLSRALDRTPSAEPGAPTGTNMSPGGRQIRVTWLIHDVRVWRMDRILFEPDGEVWIHTQQSHDGDVGFGAQGVWHLAPNPDELRSLLERLGVRGSSTSAQREAAAPVSLPGSADAETVGSWTLPALAGGVVVGVLADRLVRRYRDRDDEGGRWQLEDA
ncbi:hypothetical protein CLV30_102127 [Haloactinopolyspora alba]|uniref:Uncharacterized protein n=1 Tax=Haloactinopolyspora alba TaxID=648780 RepID=A0A2P8EB97_9ACTN|nr:hypothetical protein [Haloactinopolyspora alba]PSL06741.1 hypothetical protein CLV30_102127 [Haloactinopolyspora alba]